MYLRPVLFPILALVLAVPTVRAQFDVFPAADLVLGASDFTTAPAGSDPLTEMNFPAGVAVDPVSGKVFVSIPAQNRILRFGNSATLVNGADAEAVIGQSSYTAISSGTTATTFNQPYGIDIDDKGRLWVCDYGNNRVLMFEDAANLPEFGAAADLVLGQPDFVTTTAVVSQTKMSGPTGLHVDDTGNLWVAEYNSNRVVKFANAANLANGAAATVVLGQPDFVTGNSATSDVKMGGPVAVQIDDSGRLWVVEQNNHRILRFDGADSLANGSAADAVLGQTNFTTSTTGSTAEELGYPSAIAIDRNGTLYIADYLNNRVVYHKNPGSKANGATPDGVIGQPDLTTNSSGTTAQKLALPYGGLDFDAVGRLWVADSDNNRVLRFSPPDTSAAAPKVTSRVPKKTSAGSLAVRGTATDLNGIVEVRYRVGSGAFKPATGTTSWSFSVKLKAGINSIEIVAEDTLGNVSPVTSLRVNREKRIPPSRARPIALPRLPWSAN